MASSNEAPIYTALMHRDPVLAAEEFFAARDEIKPHMCALRLIRHIVVSASAWGYDLGEKIRGDLQDVYTSGSFWRTPENFERLARADNLFCADALATMIEYAKKSGATFPDPEPEWIELARERGEAAREYFAWQRRESDAIGMKRYDERSLVAVFGKMEK